ncbi:MAG: hypothetical protein WBM98_10055 [Maribacter sp.]|uniref:hypothetical protein n=1 Tax=Maribacter sp. TaxID=1897614 RepID=UPI003C7291CE
MSEFNKNKKHRAGQSGNHFLRKDSLKKNLAQEHKEYLGLDVPDDYFSKSKETILKSVQLKKEQKRTVFRLKPFIAYPIAASIVLLVAFTFWWQTTNNNENNLEMIDVEVAVIPNEIDPSDDFLVTSLLVDDANIDKFVNEYITNEIIVEAELSEQRLENIFINSLLIEDSVINGYIDENLIENIVL